MKKHCSRILIIAMSLLLACPLTACKKKSETKATHIKGGSTKKVDKDAPKEIESTELISLSIKSSTIASVGVEEYEGLESGVYYFEFEVDLKTKEGSGSYRFEKQYEEDEAVDYEFSADEDFMIKLEKIIRDGGISRLNGNHNKTNGIQDIYGYRVSAVYASGEKISCSDNSSNWISLETTKELNDLFREASGVA